MPKAYDLVNNSNVLFFSLYIGSTLQPYSLIASPKKNNKQRTITNKQTNKQTGITFTLFRIANEMYRNEIKPQGYNMTLSPHYAQTNI